MIKELLDFLSGEDRQVRASDRTEQLAVERMLTVERETTTTHGKCPDRYKCKWTYKGQVAEVCSHYNAYGSVWNECEHGEKSTVICGHERGSHLHYSKRCVRSVGNWNICPCNAFALDNLKWIQSIK